VKLAGPLLALVAAALATCAGAAPQTRTPLLLAFSAESAGNTDVFVAREDGSDVRRLTSSPGADFDPSLSPDRQEVAYRCQRGTSSDTCVVGVDAGRPRDLTNTRGDEWSPAWSPDGRSIAFFSDRGPLGIWLMRPDGSSPHLLVAGGEYPSSSPDAERIAYGDMATRDIAIVRSDGSHKHLVARNPAYDMSPSFSPDGRRIAFDSQRSFRHPLERGIGPEFEIYVRANGRVRRLTRNRAEDRFRDFGPDGRIVFSRGGRLWVTNRDGTHKRRLPLDGTFPDW
jgi:Tol biopolymer transport system component